MKTFQVRDSFCREFNLDRRLKSFRKLPVHPVQQRAPGIRAPHHCQRVEDLRCRAAAQSWSSIDAELRGAIGQPGSLRQPQASQLPQLRDERVGRKCVRCWGLETGEEEKKT